ncbi:hypothetical protein PG991_014401 [Apiospora marii]|uniref:Uncharacterized protein n=1 Tax=Apiospora marii TaxID=335849 RepID=A0ABR1R8U3_9PEZI
MHYRRDTSIHLPPLRRPRNRNRPTLPRLVLIPPLRPPDPQAHVVLRRAAATAPVPIPRKQSPHNFALDHRERQPIRLAIHDPLPLELHARVPAPDRPLHARDRLGRRVDLDDRVRLSHKGRDAPTDPNDILEARLPVHDRVRVDLARDLVPRLERVPVQPLRAEDGVPAVPLQRRARRRAEDELPMVLLFDRREDRLGIVGRAIERADGPDHSGPVVGGVPVVRVGAAVQRDVLVLGEDQARGRDPAARRAALLDARVRRRDGAERGVEVRDQLVVEGVAVGAQVRRVDAVRVVVEGGLVPEPDQDELRRRTRGGGLVIISSGGDHAGVPGLGERGRRVVEGPLAAGPVALRVEHRVPRRLLVGGVVARGQQHGGADVHVAAPERAQLGAADLDVLEQLRVGVVALLAPARLAAREGLDGGDVIESQGDGLQAAAAAAAATIVCHFHVDGGRHEAPDAVDLGRAVAAGKLDVHHRPVAALGPLVRGEEGLHAVLTGRQLVQARDRETVDAAARRGSGVGIVPAAASRERDGVCGAEAEDVLAEHVVRRRCDVDVV